MWIKHDGYRETYQYVNAKGRIVAEISGMKIGWYASDQTTFPPTPLGRYVTLDAAKSAVIGVIGDITEATPEQG